MDMNNLNKHIMRIRKAVKVIIEEQIKKSEIKVIRMGARDVDSTNLKITYKDTEIGYGHLNNVSNMAHITINDNQPIYLFSEDDKCDLIEFLVDGIENRTLLQWKFITY
jgi:hypothetical protein